MQSSKILLKDGQIVDLVDGRINDGDIDTWNNKLNVEITSPNGTINVQSSTDVQTNTKTFDISVNTDIVATNKDVSDLEDKINHKLDSKEDVSNKIQVVNDSSTTEYPSSKAVADFVNSSVSTNTATFLGNFSLEDLGLTYPATEVQIASALNSHIWPTGYPTNNDYVYVEISNPQSSIYDKVQRYKYRGSVASWGYEYTLNNSSFTAEEMAAIDSGITSHDVTNLRSDHTTLESHVSNTSNPHKVTKSQVGLGNVDNTRDADKPVSTAQQNALNKKLDKTGDASNTTATFTKNSGDTSSMTSSKNLSTIFTAISSFFASLKALAFKDKVSDSDINGTISDSHIASASTWNGKASSTHTHGNIQNGGTLQTNDITIANGDKLVVTDSSDSSKVARASISFDGSTTTKALTQKGTWETFNNYSHPAGSAPSKTGVPTANATPGFGGTFKVNQITTDATSHVSAVTERTITIPNATATTSADGLMSAADKTKLNGIETALDGKADKSNITGATKCKITYNSQGIVTAGNDLSASDIPNLDASKITSGTFGTARIADDAITASKVKDNETLPVNITGLANKSVDYEYVSDESVIARDSTADSCKTYFANNVSNGRCKVVYCKNGTEYTLIFSKQDSGKYGSIIKYGYSKNTIYMLRYKDSKWESTDWEVISAGTADYLKFQNYSEINFKNNSTTLYKDEVWFNYRNGDTGEADSNNKLTDYYFGDRNKGTNTKLHADRLVGTADSADSADSAKSVNATVDNSITSTGTNGSMEILNGALSSSGGGGGSCSIDGDGISFTKGVGGSSMTADSISTVGTGTFTGGVEAKGRSIDGSATILTNRSSITWNSDITNLVVNRSAGLTTTIDLKNLLNGVVYWLHVPRDNIIALWNSSAISTFYCYDSSLTMKRTTDTYDIRSHIRAGARDHGGFSTAIVRSNSNFYVMMDY